MSSTNLSRWLTRTAAIALVLGLLSSSTPAAPETIVAIAKESSVSFLFWFHASGLAKLIQGRNVGNAKAQEKQRDRDAKVSRIQIFPSDATIDLSDHVRFSAVAYDGEGNPVGGVKIKWRGQSVVPGRHVRLSPHGEFEATSPGTFNIVAEAGGKTAQVSVVVRPGVKRDLNQVPTSTHQVSSRQQSADRHHRAGTRRRHQDASQVALSSTRAELWFQRADACRQRFQSVDD